MALACLWGVPVAFALLFGSRKLTRHNSEVTKAAGVRVSDGIQETLENIREIRATNQEERFLKDLNDKIDYHEKTMLRGELHTGIFVNAASVIMRLGVATTILTGTSLILSGQIDFMVLFMFLLAITRVYAPFDQALALIAEMFMSQISASRLMEIHDAKTAEGTDTFSPAGHDIVFENVGFAYNNEQVKGSCAASALRRKRARSRPWWVPPAPAKAPVQGWLPACGTFPKEASGSAASISARSIPKYC